VPLPRPNQRGYAKYRIEILHGTHWMLDEQPDAVADLPLEWFATHPI
jgi:hypothetical protein